MQNIALQPIIYEFDFVGNNISLANSTMTRFPSSQVVAREQD